MENTKKEILIDDFIVVGRHVGIITKVNADSVECRGAGWYKNYYKTFSTEILALDTGTYGDKRIWRAA